MIFAVIPDLTSGASISSIGAFIYKQELSIRSNVGFVATPTGEGVTYSPSFPSISATMPSKGAINIVLSSDAFMTSTLAMAALHAAIDDSAFATAASLASSDVSPFVNNSFARFASLSDLAETIHACSADLSEAMTLALVSLFQSSNKISPSLTESPSST